MDDFKNRYYEVVEGPMTAIFLRDHEKGDAEDVFEMDFDPLVQAYIGGIKTREESEGGLEFVLKNRAKFKYSLKANVHLGEAKVIGYCGMRPLQGLGPELFFGLNSKYWGKGYCRQAILLYLEKEAGSIARIFATVHPDNLKSQNVLENVGFHFEKKIYYEPRKMDHRMFVKNKIGYGLNGNK